MSEKTTLKIEFNSPETALHFASWLDGQGEQDYWIWMECREQEEEGDITATRFDWGNPKLSWERRKAAFLKDPVIRATCGRLDGK